MSSLYPLNPMAAGRLQEVQVYSFCVRIVPTGRILGDGGQVL